MSTLSAFVGQKKNILTTWAVAPKENGWTLLEVKGGAKVATHQLSKACTLLGRSCDHNNDDIALVHESCSRFHAQIAFDGRGIPWLRDLASAHGTTVNHKKLPPAATNNVESASPKAGSWVVLLYPGDVIQFGASTCLFCLQGSPEYESGATQVKAVNLPIQQQVAEPVSHPGPAAVDKTEGISGGMNMDDDASPESNEKTRSLPAHLDSSVILEKHCKAWEGLTVKRYRLQNVQ
jgi:pSer/pThr/pTyr-binding forkhead associated (FHA) protein